MNTNVQHRSIVYRNFFVDRLDAMDMYSMRTLVGGCLEYPKLRVHYDSIALLI